MTVGCPRGLSASVAALATTALMFAPASAGAQTPLPVHSAAGEAGLSGGRAPNATLEPSRVAAFDDVVQVSSGAFHNLALKTDGTVWAWGNNDFGQLGVGRPRHRAARHHPTEVHALSGVIAVAAGSYHSLALLADGTVWAWGLNSSGQLGDGTVEERRRPVLVPGLAGVTQISGARAHSLVLLADGSAQAWGDNGFGELGDGTRIERHTPVAVSGLSDVTQIESGGLSSLALRSDGTVWSWGSNQHGQLGDGTRDDRELAVEVVGLTEVAEVSAGGSHSLAVGADGSAWTWGWNQYGQLGVGGTRDRHTPRPVRRLTDVAHIAAGDDHSLAVTTDGLAWSWGGNAEGQLGRGAAVHHRPVPGQVRRLGAVAAVSAGVDDSLALCDDTSLWAWGDNLFGQLGQNGRNDRLRPVPVEDRR